MNIKLKRLTNLFNIVLGFNEILVFFRFYDGASVNHNLFAIFESYQQAKIMLVEDTILEFLQLQTIDYRVTCCHFFLLFCASCSIIPTQNIVLYDYFIVVGNGLIYFSHSSLFIGKPIIVASSTIAEYTDLDFSKYHWLSIKLIIGLFQLTKYHLELNQNIETKFKRLQWNSLIIYRKLNFYHSFLSVRK